MTHANSKKETQTNRDVLPLLYRLDALAYVLEQVAALLQQAVHALAHTRGVAPRAQMADLAAQPLVVARQLEQLVHQVLRQPPELRVVREARAAAPLLRL